MNQTAPESLAKMHTVVIEFNNGITLTEDAEVDPPSVSF